jgi:hypothetical protein
VRAKFAPHLSSEDVTVWAPAIPPKAISLGGAARTNLGLLGDLIVAYDRKVNQPALSKRMREAASVDEAWKLARIAMKPQFDEGAADEAGNLYYAANLGQVRVRSAAGELPRWKRMDRG